MKLKSYIIAFSTLILFTVGGCKKELDINTDPNNAADVDVNLLLPSAEAAIAFALLDAKPFFFAVSLTGTVQPIAQQFR
jgi:hypothetical protein